MPSPYNRRMATDISQIIQTASVAAIPILFAITLHEVAHGWAARYFGDRTAEMLGRLSLNPIKHIDPMGTILVPMLTLFFSGFMFGWAKPVPVNFNALRQPKKDMVWVAVAGPASNIVMAFAWAIILKLTSLLGVGTAGALYFFQQMAEIGVFFNVLLAVFNFIPIPPLDGGRVLRGLVNDSVGNLLDRIEPFGLIIIMGLLFMGTLWSLIRPLMSVIQKLILSLVGL
jgi:Zn-dependent protease